MKIDDIVEAELIAETWDDDWADVIHNHFTKCPVCNREYAKTDAYYELAHDDSEIECSDCGTAFIRVSEFWYSDLQLKIVHLNQPHLL